MIQKNINSVPHKHLLYTDLIQKYNFQNKNSIPKLKAICITININNLLNNTDKILTEENIQKQGVFLIYYLTSLFPKITTINYHEKKNFELQIILQNSKNIESFLDDLYIQFLENKMTLKKIEKNSELIVFFSLVKENDYTNIVKKDDLNIKISFLYNKDYIKKKSLFKKYPYFWMI